VRVCARARVRECVTGSCVHARILAVCVRECGVRVRAESVPARLRLEADGIISLPSRPINRGGMDGSWGEIRARQRRYVYKRGPPPRSG
jgi:hypothetical protein